MKRARGDDLLINAIAAAHLRGQGMLQQEIARRLDFSQPDVSRYLKLAEERGWLRYPPPEFRLSDKDRSHWEKAESRFFSKASLRAALAARNGRLSARLKKVSLIHCDKDENIKPSSIDIFRY